MKKHTLNLGIKKVKVLLAYEDIKKRIINVITNDDGMEIVYELYENLEEIKDILKISLAWDLNEYPSSIPYANWMGSDAKVNSTNGKITKEGETFLGWKRTKKRKLTEDELNTLLNKEYKWIHSTLVSDFIEEKRTLK